MLKRDPNYKRVRVEGYGAWGNSSYWLAADHLLVVVMTGYTEDYRRFLYSDIRAVVIQKTRVQLIVGVVFFGTATLLALLASSIMGQRNLASQVAGWVVFGVSGLFILATLINAFTGPTCVCQISTAVHTVALPNLRRWKKAQRLLAELAPRVAAAQPASSALETGPGQSPAEPAR